MPVDADNSPFDAEALERLYAAISSPDGVTGAELRSHVSAFSTRPIGREGIQAYREGRKPWKKLRDEVVPVEHFLSARYPDDARASFPLDDQPPDAWLMVEDGCEAVGIEVTGALARAGIEVGKSLAERSVVPGFIALQDDAPSAEFARVRKRGRIMHASKGIDRAIDRAIRSRLAAKDDSKFAGYILLIIAPVGSAPDRSATDLQAALGGAAEALPFFEIFVIDGARGSPIVQLK
jgi:hypothetical protein